jgi:hypothetical protein
VSGLQQFAPLEIRVRHFAYDNKARAGTGTNARTASCTHSAHLAAKKAAAKSLGVDEARIVLRLVSQGGCVSKVPSVFRVVALRSVSSAPSV